MSRLARLVVPVLLAAGTLAAQAQTHPAPGLWEEQVTVKSDDAQMEAAMARMKERLAAMPPDQRRMVEAQMAARGVATGAAPHSVRVCISKEQADRGFVPDRNDDGKCTRQELKRSSSGIDFAYSCNEGDTQVTGHGSAVFGDSKSFSVTTESDIRNPRHPMHMSSRIVGRFVSSDCGDVKPSTMH
ncbi:MAG: DUF3617 family protein [Burkholderiaceae bacterium]